MGGPDGLTPNLDALATRGVAFPNAYATTPLTLPSHTVLLTGTEPLYNGVRNNGSYRASDELVTVAERLSGLGYHTMAVMGAEVLDARYGLDQGFAVYDEVGAASGRSERRADAVVQRATALVAEAPEPWFLWVHCFDPHWPYAAPEPWASEHPLPYDAEIAYTDAQLAPLLDAHPEALVVVTADHGESLGEHGERTHGLFVHDATTRVPLIVAWPERLPQGVEAQGVARLLDVFPTLLDLLELGPDPAVQGRSLRAHWEADARPEQPVYAESMMPSENLGLDPVTALLVQDLRIVRTGRDRLFDRAEDPGEEREQSAERPQDTQRIATALEAYQADHAGPLAQQGPGAMDAETRQRLEALGYVQAPQGDAQRADPYEQLDFIEVVGNLDTDLDARVDALWTLAQERPQAVHIWMFLIQAAYKAQSPRFPTYLQAAAEEQPDCFEIQAHWAWLLAGRDDPGAPAAVERAIEQLRQLRAASRLPATNAVKDLARAALVLGHDAHALELLDSLGELPLCSDQRFDRALLRQRAERWADAEADYRGVLAEREDDLDAWINLATCCVMQGKLEPAVEALDRALVLAPDHKELRHRRSTLEDAQSGTSGISGHQGE